MQPACSSDITPARAAAPGQYASGPATQDPRAAQTAMPHLPWEEEPKDLIQPEDCKLEPVVRGNISGLQNKTKKKPQNQNPTELATAKNQSPEDFSRRFGLTDKNRTVPFGAVGGDQTPKYFGRYSRSSRRMLSQQSES